MERIEGDFEEALEETAVVVDEGDMLTLDTNHKPRSHEHLSVFLTFGEPLLKAPNTELRSIMEMVQGKSE